MFGLDTPDLLIILVIVLLLFGSSKLPQLSKSIGESMRELRKGFSDDSKVADKTAAGKDSKDSSA
jgi:sec-independent protein translocase protein TatA